MRQLLEKPTNNVDYNKISNKDNRITAASMNFIHEVGHVLMLAHPLKGASGHVYWNNLPYAVMNQGLPNFSGGYSEASPVPTEHDKACLKAKWGV